MADEQENIRIQIDTNASEAATDVNKLGASLDSAENAAGGLGSTLNKNEKSLKAFKTQIREANQALLIAVQTFGETSEEARKAAIRVAELRDTMGAAKDLSDAFNPDQKFKALGAATQIAGTGIQGVTAAFGLFGDAGEETEKVLLKVQSAMAFSDAISNLSNLGDQFDVFKSVVTSSYQRIIAARAADRAATDAGTVSQLRQNLAILANPYVLAGAAIAALSIGIYAWVKASGEAAKQEERVSAAVKKNSQETENLGKVIDETAKSAQNSNEIEILRARAYGATEEEIQKLIKSQNKLGVSSASADAQAAYDNLVKANKNAADAIRTGNEEIIKESEDAQKSAQDLYKKSNESYEKAILEDIKTGLEARIEANKKAEDAQKEAAKKAEDERKKEAEKRKALMEERLNSERSMLQKIQDINDKTDEEKLARQKERDLAEIEILRNKGINVANMLKFNDELYKTLEQELREKRAAEEEERKAAQAEKDAEEKEKEETELTEEFEKQKEIDAAKLEQEKAVNESRLSLGEKFVGFLSAIAGKNKALQKAAIIAESALGIGRSVIATNASNVAATAEGAALAIPTGGASVAAAAGLVAANYGALGFGVATNIAATAKALQALGGGSSPSASGGGSSSGASPSTPQVQFNNTAENQIGQSVASTKNNQQPARVVVLESDITTAQRNVSVLESANVF